MVVLPAAVLSPRLVRGSLADFQKLRAKFDDDNIEQTLVEQTLVEDSIDRPLLNALADDSLAMFMSPAKPAATLETITSQGRLESATNTPLSTALGSELSRTPTAVEPSTSPQKSASLNTAGSPSGSQTVVEFSPTGKDDGTEQSPKTAQETSTRVEAVLSPSVGLVDAELLTSLNISTANRSEIKHNSTIEVCASSVFDCLGSPSERAHDHHCIIHLEHGVERRAQEPSR